MTHNPYSNPPVSTSDSCLVNRYGHFKAVLIIVGKIVGDRIQLTSIWGLPHTDPSLESWVGMSVDHSV